MFSEWMHHNNGYIKLLLMKGYTVPWLLVIYIEFHVLVLFIELHIAVESIHV